MSKVYVFLDTKPVDHTLAQNKREAWMPDGDRPYYDPMMQCTFQSRSHKRRVLTKLGMREAGELVNPSHPIQGRPKSQPNPLRERTRAWVASQGGVEGLLRQAQQERKS